MTQPIVKMFGDIYSCPIEILWTPEEREDAQRRLCATCKKICDVFVMRVFTEDNVFNYCSDQCFEINTDIK
jgi:hypothetical protein